MAVQSTFLAESIQVIYISSAYCSEALPATVCGSKISSHDAATIASRDATSLGLEDGGVCRAGLPDFPSYRPHTCFQPVFMRSHLIRGVLYNRLRGRIG